MVSFYRDLSKDVNAIINLGAIRYLGEDGKYIWTVWPIDADFDIIITLSRINLNTSPYNILTDESGEDRLWGTWNIVIEENGIPYLAPHEHTWILYDECFKQPPKYLLLESRSYENYMNEFSSEYFNEYDSEGYFWYGIAKSDNFFANNPVITRYYFDKFCYLPQFNLKLF